MVNGKSDYEDIKVQAARLVLSTAALKDSMKGENQPSEKEIFLKELGEAFTSGMETWGIKAPIIPNFGQGGQCAHAEQLNVIDSGENRDRTDHVRRYLRESILGYTNIV